MVNEVGTSDQIPNDSATSEVMTPAQVSFSMCSMAKRNTCGVDSDTIWMAGPKIRIADFDAPEKCCRCVLDGKAVGVSGSLPVQWPCRNQAYKRGILNIPRKTT